MRARGLRRYGLAAAADARGATASPSGHQAQPHPDHRGRRGRGADRRCRRGGRDRGRRERRLERLVPLGDDRRDGASHDRGRPARSPVTQGPCHALRGQPALGTGRGSRSDRRLHRLSQRQGAVRRHRDRHDLHGQDRAAGVEVRLRGRGVRARGNRGLRVTRIRPRPHTHGAGRDLAAHGDLRRPPAPDLVLRDLQCWGDTTAGWRFKPKCGDGPCNVQMVDIHHTLPPVLLTRKGADR